MQRGDIVNLIDHHEREARIAVVTGTPADGLVDLYVFPITKHEQIVLHDVVAVADESEARVEGAGQHTMFVAWPLGADSPAAGGDEDQGDEGQGDEPDAAAGNKQAARKKTSGA